MTESDGARATPLNPEEQAQWDAAKERIGEFAEAGLAGAPETELAAKMEAIQQTPLDMQRVLNAVHVPEDAGEYAVGLEKILRRIPDGWGRWISCGPGWYPLLVELDEKLARLDPDYSVHQVKEKYGRARYYYSSTVRDKAITEMMDTLVSEAEARAAQTCEECGGAGELMATGNGSPMGWLRTLCVEDAAKSRDHYAPIRELEDEDLGASVLN